MMSKDIGLHSAFYYVNRKIIIAIDNDSCRADGPEYFINSWPSLYYAQPTRAHDRFARVIPSYKGLPHAAENDMYQLTILRTQISLENLKKFVLRSLNGAWTIHNLYKYGYNSCFQTEIV